mgnify:CR=1 FL=1
MDAFLEHITEFGEPTNAFLTGVRFRALEEISAENLFHEMATGYFRDLYFNGHPDESNLRRGVSFERHRALNWVRQYSGLPD